MKHHSAWEAIGDYAEEIYNAPYCIFNVKYHEINFIKRFFNKQKISINTIEDQLIKTEARFIEAETLRRREKVAREELDIANLNLKKYSSHLEDLVDTRTAELLKTQKKLVESEKRILENRITGGFAHEMRNALAGAQLEFSTTLNYQDRGVSATDQLKNAATDLLKNISNLHERYDIPRSEIAQLLIPEIKAIVEIADNLSLTIFGVSKDLDRGLAITSQIRDYAKLAELNPGSNGLGSGHGNHLK